MPIPGVPNNPSGVNGYNEPAYGDVQREQVLTRSAPVASPGVGAPRKAQRRAVKGGRGAAAAPSPQISPAQQAEMQAQAFWQAVLADPGASQLTREYAQRALNGA